MDPKLSVVTLLPLQEVWRENGCAIAASRKRTLNAEDVAHLLRTGVVNFVVADVGKPLLWIDSNDNYLIWKAEIKPHLASADHAYKLDDFPGSYFYLASDWSDLDAPSHIVVLERQH